MTIGIIGAFGYKTNDCGGQPVKTRNLKNTLEKVYPNETILYADTFQWKKNCKEVLVSLIKVLLKSDLIIMLPANNGINVFARLLYFQKKIVHKRVYYDVIGGWLTEAVKSNSRLKKMLSFFDGIFVETKSMYDNLTEQGFRNITILPNYKVLPALRSEELNYNWNPPYPVCIFSRIVAEKGIEDAIQVITEINTEFGKEIYSLDLYGACHPDYIERFNKIISNSPDYIRYKGVASPDESVSIVKNYYLLLFPTRFYTEGIPGTIIDAYAAGTPVVSSKWYSYADVIIEGKTGFCFEFGNIDNFKKILIELSKSIDKVNSLKNNCLLEYQKYTEEAFISILCGVLGGK